ncbi:MAG: glutamate racemase [Deltaproteobacteria bacterium]|nr:glutamate racemase [Deltaproteobacteria bacterium]MBW2595700.1 glutamate racemase [Deltaproteobacteria bacterium]
MMGFFDSGFGGLTVLKSVVQELPEYNYLYLGDNARAPYGERSPETVYECTLQAVDFLLKEGCLLVIIACNTVSSGALRRIQQEFLPSAYPDRKVLGVVRPSAEEIVDRGCRRIGILATEGVVRSKIYTEELEKLNPSVKIFYQACPLLVPIIEAGKQDEEHSDVVVSEYLGSLFAREGDIDSILLSCTHYPILYEAFRRHTPPHVKILTQGSIIASKLRDYLARHPEIEERLSRKGTRAFFSTDSPEKFNRLASVFYGECIQSMPVTLGFSD